MTQHARKPAVAALLLTLAAGAAALAGTGQFRSGGGSKDLAALEKRIAGHPDAGTWAAYGDALRAAHRPGEAAEAYERSLALDPANRATKMNVALALAQAKRGDDFFAYVSRLTITDPKTAADLMNDPGVGPMHGDSRFRVAAELARAQAVD
ncbi:MAG TPA: hypothetical protein VH253_19470 [Phycisphaerae bacterium]|nr:hypothetical protein [Phycisphaerae bacterium]